jgi:hypothetical protein
MFVPLEKISIIESVGVKKQGPRKGSLAFVSTRLGPTEMPSISIFPYPYYITTVRAVFFRYGFEKRSRAERRTIFCFHPFLPNKETAEADLHQFISIFPVLVKREGKKMLQRVFRMSALGDQIHALIKGVDEILSDEEIFGASFCIAKPEIELQPLTDNLSVIAWVKTVLNFITDSIGSSNELENVLKMLTLPATFRAIFFPEPGQKRTGVFSVLNYANKKGLNLVEYGQQNPLITDLNKLLIFARKVNLSKDDARLFDLIFKLTRRPYTGEFFSVAKRQAYALSLNIKNNTNQPENLSFIKSLRENMAHPQVKQLVEYLNKMAEIRNLFRNLPAQF